MFLLVGDVNMKKLLENDSYKSLSIDIHHDFKIFDCGLFISEDYPFLGASPDGLVSCSCCSDGVCEIKVL